MSVSTAVGELNSKGGNHKKLSKVPRDIYRRYSNNYLIYINIVLN